MAGLLELGYLDNDDQVRVFTEHHQMTGSKAEMRKYWMDTKRRGSQKEIALSLSRIAAEIETFSPDILLLGDDNATNYVGNYFLDTPLPIVFWGVNGTPVKYGLVDAIDKPGHNVTGIYQKNYYKENIELLLRLAPDTKKVAVLSDASTTGRVHSKLFRKSIETDSFGIEIVETVMTNSFEDWKQAALRLQPVVDAFLISTNFSLKDADGNTVDPDGVSRWYLKNINKPEAVAPITFVKKGMLASVFDSPFKQGYETAKVAHKILAGAANPAEIAAYAPEHGGYVVNVLRAEQLGLSGNIDKNDGVFHELIEQRVDLD